MKWNNEITTFNPEGKKVLAADNTLICTCEKTVNAELICASKDLLECVTRLIPHACTIINPSHPDFKFVMEVLSKIK